MSTKPVALVTGTSRGVGKGVATALRDAGWTVFGTSRRGRGPDGVTNLTCDHTDDEAVASVFERIESSAGRLDLLVNNVWASPPGFAGFTEKFYERPLSDWDTLITVGLRAHYVASVHAAKLMTARGSGLIASISSFGSRGQLHSVLYGMSKTALDKMTFDMAHELRGTGVSTVSLWPGLVRTELLLSVGITEFAGFPISEAEDPTFIGRVIERLATSPDLAEVSGHTLITAELGAEYGITNDDGTAPSSHRGPFGGGGLFPPA